MRRCHRVIRFNTSMTVVLLTGERISDIAKMVILLKLLFCTLLLDTKLITAQPEIYSSPYTSLKFSQCLIEKMSESQFFTPEDRNSMIGVADVLDQAIRSVEYGPFSVKILLIAFVTSLADVVLTEDLSKNSFRKGVYAISLEQCSMSTVGYVDSEFIKECLRIVSSLEESEVTELRQGSSFRDSYFASGSQNPGIYPKLSDAFDPYAVNPSPVQRPFIPVDSEVNDKTIISQNQRPPAFSSFPPTLHSGSRSRFPVKSESDTHIPSLTASVTSQARKDSSSAQRKSENPPLDYDYSFDESLVPPSFEYGELNVPPPKGSSHVEFPVVPQTSLHASSQDQSVPQTDGDVQSPIQPASNKELPLRLDAISGEREPESTGSAVLTENSQRSPSNLGGLNVPQTKESSVVVVSPSTQSHNTENAPSREYNPQGIENLYPQRTETSSPEEKSPIPMTSSASLPQADELDQKATFIPTLESLISDMFLNSTDFKNAFSSGINKHNAIRLARVITEQSLSGYNSGIIREALNAVSNAVAKVKVNSPENFAFALSNALVSILKLHNLPMFVHGSQIATNILSNLDTAAPGSTESTDKLSKDFIPDVSAQSKIKDASVALEIPKITQKGTNSEIFRKMLADYIADSDEMANFFCSSDISPSSSQIYFNIIKSSLDDFGEHIASTGARTTSKILSETPKQYICSNYGEFISAAIAEILDENGFLVGANAEDISNKMILSLIQQLYATTQDQALRIASDSMSVESTTSFPPKDVPILQASFSSNFDLPFQETSTLPDVYYQSSTYYLSSFGDVNHGIPEYLVINPNLESLSYAFSPSPNIYEPSPAEEFRHKYEALNDYTSPLSSDVSHEESSFSPTWLESLISLSESSTEKAINYDSDDTISVISDDIIDQEELASHLLEEIESVLEVLSSKYDNHETTTYLPIHSSTESEIEAIEINNNTRTILDESQTKHSSNSKNHHQNNRKNLEEVPVLSPTNTAASSSLPQIHEGVENDNITLPDHQVKIRSSRRSSETTVSDEEVAVDSYSDSNIQIPSQSSSPGMIQYEFPYDYDFEDTSFEFTRVVSVIAADSIAFIRSQHFNIWELCNRLNQMAPILRIPPLDVCEEIPAIDYLLHVLRSITTKLMQV